MALTLGRLLPVLRSRGLEVPEDASLLGLGWGTVDLDRAADELATEAGLDGTVVGGGGARRAPPGGRAGGGR